MTSVVRIPDYQWAGFYYPEVYLALLEYRRAYTPELTSESDYETDIQALRSFALSSHLSNTRMDVAANELILDSAELAESVRKLFKIINVPFRSATPSTSELLILLSRIVQTDIPEYIPQYTTFSTERGEDDEVPFEVQASYDLDRTDQVSSVFARLRTQGTGTPDGSVDSGFPTRFSATSAAFTSADVGRSLLVAVSANNNAGEYPITSIVNSTTVEVSGANFVTESSLIWAVYEWSSTDYATKANTDSDEFTPWSSFNDGHMLYFCHHHIQWNKFSIVVGTTPAADFAGIWEYYDPTYSNAYPDSVTDQGGTIKFGTNSLLGTAEAEGWTVNVTYNPTGATENCGRSWSGSENYIETRGLLGQSTVDTDPLNYTITTEWVPLPNLTDGTNGLQQDGDVTYDLPMTEDERWTRVSLNDVEGFWLRFRPVEAGGSPVAPDLDRINIGQEGFQYFPFNATQGESVLNEIIGSGNGQPSQAFSLLQSPVLDDTLVLAVDETGSGNWVVWTAVQNFLNSTTTDRHYKFEIDTEGIATVTSGNGTNGRVFPTGTDNIRANSYRIAADIDGNVGARTIKGNDTGIPYVQEVWNPMSAIGWSEKDGASETNLEQLKESGPASIRNQEKAVHPNDIARVVVDEYRTADGSKIVERAFVVEEAYGPKTVQLVVVGSGGSFLTAEQLADIDLYFNGDKYATPPVYGHLLLNHEVTTVNYTPRSIDVTVQVVGKGITVIQIQNAISAYMNPLTTNDDGSYAHLFGGRFAVVMLDCAIADVSTAITNVHRTVPSADVMLGPRELPAPGTLTVTVVETE